MGRRPNAIVGDFFIRGQKLEDASNRYEHTCKKCNEHFAKGRVDSMVNHLLKKCPGMAQEDRHYVFLQMQQRPGTSGGGKKRKAADTSNTHEFVNLSMPYQQQGLAPSNAQSQPQPDVPVGYRREGQPDVPSESAHAMQSSVPLSLLLQRQGSALDTLAEVSRRHLDYSHGDSQGYMQDGHFQEPIPPREPDRTMVEQALLVALQRQISSQQQQLPAGGQDAIAFFQTQGPQVPSANDNDTLVNDFTTSPLVQAATAANHQLELSSQSQSQSNPIDPQLSHDACHNMQALGPDTNSQQPASCPEYMTWVEAPQTFATRQSPPSNEPNPDFSTLQKVDKPNARARFSESRRQQVQDNRKRGACLRCRMLKKPCSEGTPCAACSKVDSARLWKGVCIRTRIADEFTMFSVSYFGSRARMEVSTLVHGMVCRRLLGRIEAKLLNSGAPVMTFGVTRYSLGIHAASGTLHDNTYTDASTSEILLLDHGVSDVLLQVAEHCAHNITIAACINAESNVFIKRTLREAQSLLAVEIAHDEPREFKKVRPNYIAPSMLLKQVIELWVQTAVLASPGSTEYFELHLNSSEPILEALQPLLSRSGGKQAARTVLAPASRRLVVAQLLGAIESCAQRLCKAVLNELERRLLQRQQVSTFATFISAVVLLNVVERMTAFYQSIDASTVSAADRTPNVQTHGKNEVQTSTDKHVHEATDATNTPHNENQSQALPALWRQGSHFAKLLTLLLRLRALPPSITRTADNKLVVLRGSSLSVRVNGAPAREHVDEEAEKAAKWLDPMNLAFDAVMEWQNGNNAGGGPRSWDGRFIGPLLVGTGVSRTRL